MPQRFPMWVTRVAIAGALAALVAWSFHQRWQLLAASPFPLGVDGYFYPIQLRALLEHGELQYPTSPVAFYLLAPFAALTDPVLGAKLGAALLGAAIAVPAYGVGARLASTDDAADDALSRGAGLLAAVIATTSVGSAYLTIEFVKNGVGLTVALAALWLVLRAAARPSRPWIVGAIAGAVAAYGTHKMAAAIVSAVAVPAMLAAAHARRRRITIVLLGLAAAALGLGVLAPQRFLSPADAALLADLVTATPRWTAPALADAAGELQLGHDALIGLGLAVFAIAMRLRLGLRAGPLAASRDPAASPHDLAASPRDPAASPRDSAASPRDLTAAPRDSAAAPAIAAATWPILVLAIAIGLPFLAVDDRDGLGFRLRLAAFVPAALVAAIVARDAAAWLARGRRHLPWLLAGVAVVLAVLRQPGSRLEGQVVTHPALVAAVQALDAPLARTAVDVTLIVPERHIAFMVAWYTGRAIALRPDATPPERRLRVLPLHFIRAGSALDRQLLAARDEPSLVPPVGVHPSHPNGLVLVTEPTWRWLLARLPPPDRARYAAWPTL